MRWNKLPLAIVTLGTIWPEDGKAVFCTAKPKSLDVWGKSPLILLKPLIGRVRENTLNYPPCPITPMLLKWPSVLKTQTGAGWTVETQRAPSQCSPSVLIQSMYRSFCALLAFIGVHSPLYMPPFCRSSSCSNKSLLYVTFRPNNMVFQVTL